MGETHQAATNRQTFHQASVQRCRRGPQPQQWPAKTPQSVDDGVLLVCCFHTIGCSPDLLREPILETLIDQPQKPVNLGHRLRFGRFVASITISNLLRSADYIWVFLDITSKEIVPC